MFEKAKRYEQPETWGGMGYRTGSTLKKWACTAKDAGKGKKARSRFRVQLRERPLTAGTENQRKGGLIPPEGCVLSGTLGE